MRKSSFSKCNNAAKVEQHLDTAYDKVVIVADNIEAVTAIAAQIDNGSFDTVISAIPDIQFLVAHYDEITQITAISKEIGIVATIKDSVVSVAANMDAVLNIENNLETIKSLDENMDAVVGLNSIAADITLVAQNAIETVNVSENMVDVVAVATNMADVVKAAEYVDEIRESVATTLQAEASAIQAKDLAIAAKDDANTYKNQAAEQARLAQEAFDNFDDRYLGKKNTPPTTDNDGNPLQVGSSYWQILSGTDGELRFWNGAEWESPEATASQAAQVATAKAQIATDKADEASQSSVDAAKRLAELYAAGDELLLELETQSQAKLDELQSKVDNFEEKVFYTDAQFELMKEERKRIVAGSGVDCEGIVDKNTHYEFGQIPNTYKLNTANHVIDGVVIPMDDGTDGVTVELPQAPDATKTLTTDGEVHKYNNVAGVGEKYEAYTTDFNGSTYLDMRDNPYQFTRGAKVELKFKWNGTGAGKIRYLLSDGGDTGYTIHAAITRNNTLGFSGFSNLTLNGQAVKPQAFTPVANVEYHLVGDISVDGSFERIGDWKGPAVETWFGEIWDIKFSDPNNILEPVRYYPNIKPQPATQAAPSLDYVENKYEKFSDNDLPRTRATIVGTKLQKVASLQASQKAFMDEAVLDSKVILTRKDLVFLETWKEKVSEKDIVVPYGNVNYAATAFEGINLVKVSTLGIDKGYSAFGEWDTVSDGYCVKWSTLSKEGKLKFCLTSNVRYNPDDGEYYQERYRVRVVEGLGDNWFNVQPHLTTYGMCYNTISGNLIAARGQRTDQGDYDTTVYNYTCNQNTSFATFGDKSVSHYPLRNHSETADVAAEGKAFAMPICLVQRLNQGAYHPEYNEWGCRKWRDEQSGGGTLSASAWWYGITDDRCKPTSTEQAFNVQPTGVPAQVAASSTSGYIGSAAGSDRPTNDPYPFYDGIYADQVENLLLNANKQDPQVLLTKAIHRAVKGETQGKGRVPFTKAVINQTAVNNSIVDGVRVLRFQGDVLGLGEFNTYEQVNGSLVDDNGVSYDVTLVNWASSNSQTYIYTTIPSTDPLPPVTDVSLMIGRYLSPEYDSLPWVDIIGDPVRIAATFPNGCVGQWIDFIPDAIASIYALNEKSNSSTAFGVYTNNDGVSWGSAPYNLDTVANTLDVRWSVNYVALIYYPTLSNFTESDDNHEAVVYGDVLVTNSNQVDKGNRIASSVLDVVNTGVADYEFNSVLRKKPNEVVYYEASIEGVVCLPKLIVKHGLYYVQWVAKKSDSDSVLNTGDVIHTEIYPVGIAHGE